MTTPILVSVAWPYANAEIHVGNLVGANLPADIFARYQRLVGNRVLMVSGSDAHGTPISVRAETEGKPVLEVYERFHQKFIELHQKLGISYDLFTSTHTENHFRVSQQIFLNCLKNDGLYLETQKQLFSKVENRFLPDRFVEGTCYICGYDNARGDQCDKCGNLLDATLLINPRSKHSGDTHLEIRETQHFFIDLGKLSEPLSAFLDTHKEHWRPNVLNVSKGQIAEGLRGRPITRDLEWGIPVPLEGYAGKCLYVWFEAVIGYLSASVEYSQLQGTPQAWHDWWYNPSARSYYFIGKDNIPFHAIIWPAELLASRTLFADDPGEQLNLPYDVPANEFMNLEGQKISGSRNWAVWGLDVTERYGPDAVRYYLTQAMPVGKDSDWSWQEFVARNNDELVANWGNLVNRLVGFANKHFEGKVPDAGTLTESDTALLSTLESGFNSVGELLNAVKLRPALQETLRLATEVNRYLDQTAPWTAIKTDRAAAARAVYVALRAIDSLKVLFAPFIPHSSEQVHQFLGYDGTLFGTQELITVPDNLGSHNALTYNASGATGRWQASQLAAGQALRTPKPLFRKLEPSIAEEELAKLGHTPS